MINFLLPNIYRSPADENDHSTIMHSLNFSLKYLVLFLWALSNCHHTNKRTVIMERIQSILPVEKNHAK